MTNPLDANELDSELAIGLVCAVGTEINLVIDLLRERLGRAGYHTELVKISQEIIPQVVEVDLVGCSEFERYTRLMDAGDDCRRLGADTGTNDPAILANGAATYIASKRRTLQREMGLNPDSGAIPLPKTAYIIDSLKRPEEVERLRIVYGSGFILLGVHSEASRRREHLVNNKGMSPEDAQKLINRDQEASNKDHGQRVNATFHLADFFVSLSDNHSRLRCDIQRLVELWFGNPFLTPSFDEYAMFLAFAAALRSADLSRQVGAVIARGEEILSTGANECPSPKGGLYWPKRNPQTGCLEDVPRGRDFTRGGDSNREEQLAIIERIIGEVRAEDPNFDGETLKKVLKKSGIRDLTEFGRVVHAEMEAILSCSRRGISCLDAHLYCTTFPCHNCAKHIIAAGIERVAYVEPYSKSKAFEFHDDSIVSSGTAQNERGGKVVFEPFVGVGPRRFFELFSMNLGSSYPLTRKNSDTGKKLDWRIEDAQLRLQMKPTTYLDMENTASKVFGESVSRAKGNQEMDQ
ncbi:MAG: cytidine deaminase [Pirellulaceae bacterium]|nr:cytidine deaminase [Pirellulaceae bacterium]